MNIDAETLDAMQAYINNNEMYCGEDDTWIPYDDTYTFCVYKSEDGRPQCGVWESQGDNGLYDTGYVLEV